MDHCSLIDTGFQYALRGNTNALVTRGVFATLGYAYPSPSTNSDSGIDSIQKLLGVGKVGRIDPYSTDELIAAARFCHLPREA